ncbi:hypothetical protein B0J11DRAFT_499354 [Dendryphion nanum]|uniref:P-loop containing nucleoside triphosphate hydrolase protein n=1 Tax=Dendryphion nanum TaxID=256645 RepID=A0A9P9D0A0_9PLEO|nr:hypothetical protein B0J11DRAFT_499354 [Dendryphion nanum]
MFDGIVDTLAQKPSTTDDDELERLRDTIPGNGNSGTAFENGHDEQLKQSPLIWWDVKQHLAKQDTSGTGLSQYAVLGHVPDDEGRKPVLLNTNYPWSAFLCGSQGSGKSHTLSCMLENCLLTQPGIVARIGKTPNPLAGLVFHYDKSGWSGVSEASYLCSHISTTVLVSPSNYGDMKVQYESMAEVYGGLQNLQVEPLYLSPSRLNLNHMLNLMAVNKNGEPPLYVNVIKSILRQLKLQNGGKGSLDLQAFESALSDHDFTDAQRAPMDQRMDLLKSFLDLPPILQSEMKRGSLSMQGSLASNRNHGSRSGNMVRTSQSPPAYDWKSYIPRPDYLAGEQGRLLIIDLTDPLIEAEMACALFDICLSIFSQQTKCNKIVTLDEAHNYMSNTTNDFTQNLIATIRLQRHASTRVVIATQEPTLNTDLLDLCNITMIHRFSSPSWLKVLKSHIAGVLLHEGGDEAGDHDLLRRINKLKLGESLLFCPTAAFKIVQENGIDEVQKMAENFVKFRTRLRVTADGGITR